MTRLRFAQVTGLLLLVGPALAQSPGFGGFRLRRPQASDVLFRSCQGLGSMTAVLTTGPGGTLKSPGATAVGDASCARSLLSDRTLDDWRNLVVAGAGAARVTARLSLLDSLGGVVAEWRLTNAWPSSLTVSMDSSSATETVVLAADALQRTVVGAPFAADDAYATTTNTPLDVPAPGVLGNDSAAGAMRAALVSPPANGTVVLGGDGSFHYAPATGFAGTDAFTYEATSGGLDSLPATVAITVGPPNLPPVANGRSASTDSCTPLAITLTARDPEAQPLTYRVVSGPSSGALSGTPPSVTYTPNKGFIGNDGFTFVANDGVQDSAPALVTIVVTAGTGCDGDADGVSDATEDAAPNGGDGNFDGIPDRLQTNVTSLPSSSGPYLTIAASGACQSLVAVHVERDGTGSIPKDAGFSHPFGLVGFRIPCPEGQAATITIYYHGAKVPPASYRKYGPPLPVAVPGSGNSSWYTLAGVTFTSAHDGIPPTATFTLTSGAAGDDSAGDAAIVDDGGAADPDAAAPVPALGALAMAALALLLALAGFHAARRGAV